MWVPGGWMHETCSLDDYSIGLGGITFVGADLPQSMPGRPCPAHDLSEQWEEQVDQNLQDRGGEELREYRLDKVPYCAAQPARCPSLPTRPLCA